MAMSETRTWKDGAREFYREGRIEFAINAGARPELAGRMMADGVHPAAEAIAQRCNDASSWGGYHAYLGDQVARVYAGRTGADTERARRLLSAVGMVQP